MKLKEQIRQLQALKEMNSKRMSLSFMTPNKAIVHGLDASPLYELPSSSSSSASNDNDSSPSAISSSSSSGSSVLTSHLQEILKQTLNREKEVRDENMQLRKTADQLRIITAQQEHRQMVC